MRTLLLRLPAGLASACRLGLRRFLARLVLWQARSREREHLVRMNDAELKDIGITRWDALREADKPFWRP